MIKGEHKWEKLLRELAARNPDLAPVEFMVRRIKISNELWTFVEKVAIYKIESPAMCETYLRELVEEAKELQRLPERLLNQGGDLSGVV